MSSERTAPTTRAYIALGANLGDPVATLEQAIDAICALPSTLVVKRSSWYRSAPIGYAAQPDFINGVIAVDTSLDADALLSALLAIEDRLGRVRSFDNAPRTIDLDVLLYGELVQASGVLTVPHPRMHERAFVLAPLIEITPDIQIPKRGSAQRLLQQCEGQRVERIGQV